MLEADPNSDRLVLGVHNGNNGVWLSLWNGSSWETSATITATTVTGTNTKPVMWVAFERKSGNALAAYRKSGGVSYRILKGARWSSEQTVPGYSLTPSSISLSSDTGSNKIMLLMQDEGGNLHGTLWDGDSETWGTVTELETKTGEFKNQPFVFLWD